MSGFKSHYSRPLADYPYILVRVWCWDCSRRGNYRLARLAACYGADITMFDLLERLVDCPRWKDENVITDTFCGAYFHDLMTDEPPGLPPGQLRLRLLE